MGEGISVSIHGRELDAVDRELLADLEKAVQGLVRNGWRVAHDEISDMRSFMDEGIRRSLKLELRRGPLMSDGC